MADPDPESEALIRKLHRELNGLTRRSRQHVSADIITSLRRVTAERKAQHDSVTESEDVSDKGLASRPSSEGEPVTQHQRDKKQKRDSTDNAAERPAKVARKRSPAAADAKPSKPPAIKIEPAAVPSLPTPSPTPSSPLEQAASVASTMTRDRVKQQTHQSKHAGTGKQLQTVKCFHAGVRWGVTLKAEAIKKRSDLATALNDAYAGQILSCGRGEMLHVVFLDQEGQTVEFPALRSDAKENASKWAACVDKAARIYVMR